MKRLINLSIILVLVSVFTTSVFAQEQNNQNRKMVKAQTLQSGNAQGVNWVDADGDGICDNAGTNNQRQGKGHGLKDGSGSGVRPQDGTGFGKGSGAGSGSGTGECDGTGPKGSQKRGGKN